MKKILSTVAVSALILSANVALAGSQPMKTDGCPENCQKEIDTLQSNQDRQNEQLKSQEDTISRQAAEIDSLKQAETTTYFPWYVKAVGKLALFGNLGTDPIVGTDSIGFDTASTGYGWGVAVGKQYDRFRIELQYDSNKTDLDDARLSSGLRGTNIGIGSGDIRVDTFMVNGYYDYPIADGWSVYGMAGMGYGDVTLSIYNVDDNEPTFAYRFGLGVSYAFAANQAIDMGWEYLGTSDVVIDVLDVNDINTNNFLLAYRFSF